MDEELSSFAANDPGDGPRWPAVFYPDVPDLTAAHVAAACVELYRPGVAQVADDAVRSMLHDLDNRGVEAEDALLDWVEEALVGKTDDHLLRVYRPLWEAPQRAVGTAIAAARQMHVLTVRRPPDEPRATVFEVGLASDRDAGEAETWVRYAMVGRERMRPELFERPEPGTRADVPFFHPDLPDDAARHIASEYTRVAWSGPTYEEGVPEVIVAMDEDLKRRGLGSA